MRQIKYRAWHKKENKMIQPIIQISLAAGNDWVAWYETTDDAMSGILTDAPLEHVELMQYTGYKDRNGVEIYELDILDVQEENFPFVKNWEGIVKMVTGSYLVENFEGTDGEYLFDELRVDEVIGNIYENANLLPKGIDATA